MSEKKNEFLTYKKLRLGREHKSARRRSRAEEEKLYRYIGENTTERPYLKVSRSEYLIVREKAQKKLIGTKTDLADLERLRIERAVYDEFARREEAVSELEDSFQKKHGRKMTPHEKNIYSRMPREKSSPVFRAKAVRKAVLNEVLKKIEGQQHRQPARLQEAWATAVGHEAAQETFLEKVENGVAVCRCLSSTLSFQLRRRKDLAPQLSKLLGAKIQRVIFR